MVAVDCFNLVREGGLLASIDSDDITDDSWLCTNVITSNAWYSLTYNDSSWPHASIIEQNFANDYNPGIFPNYRGIASNAKWINTNDYTSPLSHTYCRFQIFQGKTCFSIIIYLNRVLSILYYNNTEKVISSLKPFEVQKSKCIVLPCVIV